MSPDRREAPPDLRSVPLNELEAQRYTRLTWRCAMCQWVCSQGLRLMRIRRQSTASSTITTIAATLRCPKCRHAPDPATITPTKG